jgi:hypothetical protein
MHTFPKEYAYSLERVCILWIADAASSPIPDARHIFATAFTGWVSPKYYPEQGNMLRLLWSFRGHFMVIVAVWWPFGGHLVVVSWSFHGHLVVIWWSLWSFRGHFVVICFSPNPRF